MRHVSSCLGCVLGAIIGCGSGSTAVTEARPAAPANAAVEKPPESEAPLPSGPYEPKGLDLGIATVNDLVFVDARTGYLAADTGVWRTTDGGESWSQLDLDRSLMPRTLWAERDARVLWVGGGRFASGAYLWSSADGGDAFEPRPWQGKSSPDVLVFAEDVGLALPFNDPTLLRSLDRGATWVEHPEPAPYVRAAVSGTAVWLAGGEFNRRDGAAVARSTDRGATWRRWKLSDDAHTYTGGDLAAISAPSPNEAWVAGESRQLFHTSDGGDTWTQIKGVPPWLYHFGGVHASGRRIVAAGSTRRGGDQGYAVWTSEDGGATFAVAEELRCPKICGTVSGVASPRPGVYFVYGYAGLLHRYVAP